ncbi:heme-copper oxidase subunit III [Haloferax sp. ATB1]|uniref:cytochrome c oxidase subunit 3 n=1 Tax=Haloferax sp. ATB1 TaxID=1508454 RepID=UPI0005B22F03|nr:heme-copper oxidase subunit III [Haloferax sp. ATB1]
MGLSDTAVGSATGEHEHTSRWPLVTAGGAAGLYAGAGLFLVGSSLVPTAIPLVLVGLGVLGFLGGIAGWTYEAFLADYWDASTTDREPMYVSGMVLFLVSDVATFLAGFVYYGFIRVGTWPPTELPHLLGSLVLVNTLLLVVSSVTLHYGHHALEAGNRRGFLGGMAATVVLGVVFLGGQVLEYYEFIAEEGFTLTSGAFASAFYGLTGLHGLHVSLGVLLLILVFGRALRGQYTAERDTSVRTVALYWHFVDVVWIFLVAVVYVGAELG